MVSYTYRNDFAKDLGTTLDEIRQLGITDMEFSSTFGHPAERIRQELDDRGMQCSSYGVGYVDLQNSLRKVIADASSWVLRSSESRGSRIGLRSDWSRRRRRR
jgi:sugar phosphate isomerase/epimerase